MLLITTPQFMLKLYRLVEVYYLLGLEEDQVNMQNF